MAGFEGADHVNGSGQPLSMIASTRHVANADLDYRNLASLDIRCARESAGWRLCEVGGAFQFKDVLRRADAARRVGVQLMWTMLHYGWPADVDVFSEQFAPRFARFCEAAARALKPYADDADVLPIFTPINEISFLSWAVCQTGLIHPYRGDMGARSNVLKRQLVKAALAGADAIRDVIPRARMLYVDPVVHVVAAADRPQEGYTAAMHRSFQFQAWDMLTGRVARELGGNAAAVDFIGANYYHDNQWECGTGARLDWYTNDDRRVPLRMLLTELYERYHKPLIIAETSHVGEGRGAWIKSVAAECRLALDAGLPLQGICLYPIIDRPDWERPSQWHHSGMWDLCPAPDGELRRVLCEPYAQDLRAARQHLDHLSQSHLTWQGLSMLPLLVISHLRWDFVFQRPQHLMNRFARSTQVLFIEEPVYEDGPPRMEVTTPAPNVRVFRPRTPVTAPGFHDDQLPVLRQLIAETLVAEGIDAYCAWLFTPLALPLLQQLHPHAVIYDCMDELTAFRNAPLQLKQRETALLHMANVVFTGGPSLYKAKRDLHPSVHCFPSSVDAAHFSGGPRGVEVHPSIASLPTPRLGYFGVIDERFDAALIERLADAHPEWQICLVGPVVKIDPRALPQRANVHYFGPQLYADLPRFVAGWDVCLMPFALNESTRFISPTKTLEYMAAKRPIVSTAITDVRDLFSDVVSIADTPAAFVVACEAVLAESADAANVRAERMQEIVAAHSWDTTVAAMRILIEEAILAGPTRVAREMLDAGRAAPTSAVLATVDASSASHTPCLIVGAGPTGLSAAYHYGADSVVLEKNDAVGGWCRSVEDAGFTFDYAGHIMFSNDAYVLALYKLLLGDNIHWQNREAWVFSKGVHTRYPFQGALYGLPPNVLKECLVGAIEARYGTLNSASPAIQPFALQTLPAAEDCCADGVAGGAANEGDTCAAAPGALPAVAAKPSNFEQFIYRVWGAGVAKHFAIPYNQKLWTVPLSDMETSWLGGRVPLPNLEEMIDGALQPVAKPQGPNARFGYPLRGGFQAMMSGFLPHLKGRLELNAAVERVSPAARTVWLCDGRRFTYDTLISTLPLPELIAAMGDEAPHAIRVAAKGLRYVSIRCVNIGVGRAKISDKHWIYYPESTVFHRVFLQGNASPHCNPEDGFGLTCEISYSATKPLPLQGKALIDRCVADCVSVGLIRHDDPIITANEVDMKYAYVVYDHERDANVRVIREWLKQHDILLAGRYSEWEYYNSDHAFLAGKKAAEMAATLTIGHASANAMAGD